MGSIFIFYNIDSSNLRTSYILSVSFFISFTSKLYFSDYRPFVSLGSFIPRYFTLFDAIVNGISPLISLSGLLLLVYRNTTDFCILILYPVTLPNSLLSSSSFLVASSGSSMYSIDGLWCQNRDIQRRFNFRTRDQA